MANEYGSLAVADLLSLAIRIAEAMSRESILEVRIDALELTESSNNIPIAELQSPLSSKNSELDAAATKLESIERSLRFAGDVVNTKSKGSQKKRQNSLKLRLSQQPLQNAPKVDYFQEIYTYSVVQQIQLLSIKNCFLHKHTLNAAQYFSATSTQKYHHLHNFTASQLQQFRGSRVSVLLPQDQNLGPQLCGVEGAGAVAEAAAKSSIQMVPASESSSQSEGAQLTRLGKSRWYSSRVPS